MGRSAPLPDRPPWAQALVLRRLNLGLSQEQVALESEILTQRTVSELETGRYSPVDLTNRRVVALAKGLRLTPFRLQELIGLNLGFDPPALEAMRIQPDFEIFPVYGSASAGNENAEPISGESVGVPKDKLALRGAKPENVRVYIVNGNCMQSESAKAEYGLRNGDAIAVDIERAPKEGDFVAVWDEQAEKLIVKAWRENDTDYILYPINKSYPRVVRRDDDSLRLIGVVFWRGG
jgi:SOS-response transcriptional repressor LexA